VPPIDFLVVQFLTGLANACSLFLVSSGLSLVFGVTRIVNFAHGSLYMIGAYVAYSVATHIGGGPFGFWLAVLASGLCVGALGLALEVGLLRHLYRSPELMHLVATFGVVLIVQDAVLHIWGPEDLLGPRPAGLDGSVAILGQRVPAYDLVLMALGPAALVALWLGLTRTRWGVLVRAATEDRHMVAALGVDDRRLFASVLVVGAFLAGVGGALQLPRVPAHLGMDLNIIAEAFVVVVVGGMGSIGGAFLAAILVAEVHAFGILVFPQITLVLVFLVMLVVLTVRPTGLLGPPSAEAAEPAGGAGRGAVVPPWLAVVAVVLAAALPVVAGEFALRVGSEILILAVFAVSLQWLVGTGGTVSFGHAAYFGLGAYTAALLTHHLGAAMGPALVAAPIAGAVGAVVCGWFCARLGGVYFAMLTLAFAQILWSAASQWYDLTGGDNGILGVWPAAWAADAEAFYYGTLAVCVGAFVAVRGVERSIFGYALRACRDSPVRSEAIGLDVGVVRRLAFTVSGAIAGLAGGAYAFLKGSVFPDVLAIPTSIDGLVMLMLGGIGSIGGAIAGAAAFTGLKTVLVSATDLWRALLGLAIVIVVVRFPGGLLGGWTRRGRPPA
jgi:branched-chain amino acid transport system permease protein